MGSVIERIEKFILWALVLMLLLAVLLSTIEVGRILFKIIFDPPFMLIEPKTLFQSFGMFLICLIGLELMKLLKFHIIHHAVKPELVVEVVLIAICNKVVTIDVKEMEPMTIIGLAALILSLAAVYYSIAKFRIQDN